MEADKYSWGELSRGSVASVRELADEIRRDLAMMRMDVMSDKKTGAARKRQLKKALARALTALRQKKGAVV